MLTPANITHQTPYSEIKAWFETNMDQLPETLDGECKYYRTVAWTAQLYIDTVEREKEKWGDQIKKSTLAKAAKANLVTMWKDLQDPEAWNLPHVRSIEEDHERRKARQKFHKR